jgi:transposase
MTNRSCGGSVISCIGDGGIDLLGVVRRVVREQLGILHHRLLAIVRDDDVCRRLMTTPNVGPVIALTYRVTVDVPARFRNSKAVGAVFGLTPANYQSGENDRTGAISRCGDEMMRMTLRSGPEHAGGAGSAGGRPVARPSWPRRRSRTARPAGPRWPARPGRTGRPEGRPRPGTGNSRRHWHR